MSFRSFARSLALTLIVLSPALLCSACSIFKKKEGPSPFEQQISAKPQTPEEAKKTLSSAKDQFLYGRGMGSTALTVGTIVAFPPYGLYVLGNSLLTLGGYENLYISDLLPEQPRQAWNSGYDYVISAPGKLNARMQEREFVEEEGLFGGTQ